VGCGRVHDFRLYTDTIGVCVLGGIKVQADSGYQGIVGVHGNSETPRKRPRGGALTVEEKDENRRISRERILIESVNAKIKVFKIMSNRYRNRRKRHGLRANLICGIINFETRI
jgi:hypothetical protein